MRIVEHRLQQQAIQNRVVDRLRRWQRHRFQTRQLPIDKGAFALLELWKVPAWIVVIGAGVGAALLALV